MSLSLSFFLSLKTHVSFEVTQCDINEVLWRKCLSLDEGEIREKRRQQMQVNQIILCLVMVLFSLMFVS